MKTNPHHHLILPRGRLGLLCLFSLACSPAAFSQAVWTGGGADTNWTTGANWGGSAPANDGSVTVSLSAASGGSSNVDTPYAVKSVTFTANSGSFELTGSELSLYGTGAGADTNYLVANSTTGKAQVVDNDLRMMAAGAFRANTNTLTLNGAIDFNGVSNVRFLAESGRTLVLNGTLKGNATSAVVFNSSGTVEVNGDNTYTGTTKIWSSTTVKLGSATALGASTNAVVLGTDSGNSAGTPALLTNAAITVSRDIRVSTSGDAGRVATVGGASADVSTFSGNIFLKTYSGAAGDAMPLTVTAAAGGRVNFTGNITREANSTGTRDNLLKTGAGIVALSGTNTYSGTTTAGEGTLLIDGTLSSGGGEVLVQDGATLGGDGGTINRDVRVESGGTFSPGELNVAGTASLAGTLTLNGGLTFENGAKLSFDQGDTVTVNGDLTLAGILSITSPETWSLGLHTLFQYTGELNDTGLALDPSLGAMYSLNTSTAGLVQLAVAAIPEPATWTILLGGAALFGAIAFRRRARLS